MSSENHSPKIEFKLQKYIKNKNKIKLREGKKKNQGKYL